MRTAFTLGLLAMALAAPKSSPARDAARCAAPRNLALNPDRQGRPSPLESDRGWGGGSDAWELVDGRTSYETWAHGLAFTGGHQTSAGGPPYQEPAGPRQATIDLGALRKIERVVVWNHGAEHTPAQTTLAVWDGATWIPVSAHRESRVAHADGKESGSADSDVYTFAPVVGSKVRYAFDNRGPNLDGTFNVHGWLYELEVFGCE